jgi:energy-coupling factor transport system ATP-binding protein
MIKLKNISYSYPFRKELVLQNINCEIRKGEAVLFTGPSGCGKSTLMRVINGLIPHFFQGHLKGTIDINGIKNNERGIPGIAKDIGTLFQDPEQQFFTLDVESELAFAHEQRGTSPGFIKEMIDEMSEKLGIKHILKSSIFNISEGEKQKVALGTVLSMKPGIILLDEPTANLDPHATLELGKMILKLKEQGMTIIIVDHRLYWLQDIVVRVFILDKGQIIKEGNIEILKNAQIIQKNGLRHSDISALLSKISKIPPPNADKNHSVKIEHLTFAYGEKPPIFDNRSFGFPKGKVTAVTGSNGCGKTTLARILTGLNKIKSGTLTIDDKNISTKKLLERAGLVFQNSDHQLFMNTIKRELLTSGKHLPKADRELKSFELLTHFNLAEFADSHPQSLSGGQKQRLVIACALMKSPDILILDEPTSGLDGNNMQIISHILRQTAESGACVIVITHDLELIAAACDYKLDLSK